VDNFQRYAGQIGMAREASTTIHSAMRLVEGKWLNRMGAATTTERLGKIGG
jgi:hypothetical protein